MKTVFTITFFVCMMLIASIAWSEIVYVNGTTGDDATGERGNPDNPFKTIQKGIDVAVSSEDTVLVANGTYTGTGNKNLDFKGKAVIVRSENGAENCIIDCQSDGRGFYFHSGETSKSVVSGFTITNGSPVDGYGGGIYCTNSSSPTIEKNIIEWNSAGDGGGIYCDNSSPTIQNNKIIGNLAIGAGGGIYCMDSSSKIQNNEISANSSISSEGGGIFCNYSSLTIQNNKISWNSAAWGGGIHCRGSPYSMIQNNEINENSASLEGGGICCKKSSPGITNNTISGNSASNGGGIYCTNSYPMISNNEIIENIASNGGGGIYYYYSSSSPKTIQNNKIRRNSANDGGGIFCLQVSFLKIKNNEIIGNSASNRGGGIYVDYSSYPEIINNAISGNLANFGGGIYCRDCLSPTVLNTILWADSPDEIYVDETSEIDITYSDIQGGWPGEGNIDADPLFVNPDNGIYYLQAGSPCLSTANCEGAPETDKDGQPRPLGSGCDMGCYEECDNGIFGYISSNCDISAYDASLVLQSVVGLIDLSECQKIAADVTGNGTVTALDAALILQYTVGLITQFPIQKGAPVFTVKDENQILTKIIAELENVPLTTEQRYVLEQLKQLIGRQSIPNHTSLLQNYPNPFNPETWIPYKLAKDASVTIRIYNVKGQLIRALHLGNKNAGVYVTKEKAAHWDGKDSLGQS